MDCTNCGYSLDAGSRVCIRCGASWYPVSLQPMTGEAVDPVMAAAIRMSLKGVQMSLDTVSVAPTPDDPKKPSPRPDHWHDAKMADEVKALKYKIVILKGRRAGERFDVGRIITFGRTDSCEVQLPDISVSREHARIVYHADRNLFLLQDLGSHNGTKLNGVGMDRAELASGDRIGIGLVEVAFVYDSDEDEATDLSLAVEPLLGDLEHTDEVTAVEHQAIVDGDDHATSPQVLKDDDPSPQSYPVVPEGEDKRPYPVLPQSMAIGLDVKQQSSAMQVSGRYPSNASSVADTDPAIKAFSPFGEERTGATLGALILAVFVGGGVATLIFWLLRLYS